jgi:hypothetical protein
MQSLEIALGKDALTHAVSHAQNGLEQIPPCPSTPILVKIITPPEVAKNPPPGFRTLMNRYPILSFVGALPDSDTIPTVLRRFQGFSSIVDDSPQRAYSNVLLCDLDVIFQRNPFTLSDFMPGGVELLYFAEWRGLKIGQCNAHLQWFNDCSTAPGWPYISPEQTENYKPLDRICAGSTYGTSRAMAVYLRTMAGELKRSKYECNDQAVHIHIFYSHLLDAKLSQAGFGKVELVPNADALLGSVGTTPMVRFNHWGEILNEKGEVQVAVHQYKNHEILSNLVWKKYGWVRELEGTDDDLGKIPDLKEDNQWTEEVEERKGGKGGEGDMLLRYKVGDATKANCDEEEKLCSCKYEDCQVVYE